MHSKIILKTTYAQFESHEREISRTKEHFINYTLFLNVKCLYVDFIVLYVLEQ